MSMGKEWKKAAVLGGGSFGTSLAELVARRGQEVMLWVRRTEQAEAINSTRRNPQYLSDFELNPLLKATSSLDEALKNADWVIVAVPSQALRSVLELCATAIAGKPIVLAAKGIERGSLMTMEEVAIDVLGEEHRPRLMALSGPSFAREIMLGYPTAVVVACIHEALAKKVSDYLFCDTFRAYTTTDIVGVEIGGALKNVMAIAAGGVIGMKLGSNVRATLMTRGLSEMTRIAIAKGGNPLTLSGLSGVGDLTLTCTGGLSRNRMVGQLMGEGKTLAEALDEIGQVAEGVATAKSAFELAKKLDVEVPIIDTIHQVLHLEVPAQDAFLSLVRRPTGTELDYR